mmetsp:Transcript_27579/g.63232  ORF Transcript_27579/g.63232 Transcript_27579/m.63232 type:complete len:228 (-) Transcript_27579:273-956(-)
MSYCSNASAHLFITCLHLLSSLRRIYIIFLSNNEHHFRRLYPFPLRRISSSGSFQQVRVRIRPSDAIQQNAARPLRSTASFPKGIVRPQRARQYGTLRVSQHDVVPRRRATAAFVSAPAAAQGARHLPGRGIEPFVGGGLERSHAPGQGPPAASVEGRVEEGPSDVRGGGGVSQGRGEGREGFLEGGAGSVAAVEGEDADHIVGGGRREIVRFDRLLRQRRASVHST